ncbi:uncharacterized protein LOC131689642 [Topomyia yanbarensis]|uniref:uncharacterized protein LOC131689642 n=1 Tax=Topomyia yanbarensis TaxID=2498891 RepID=UPI00273ACC5F|nr:uncharacterized protein LOC131689642 [Topomyia yanbarensis]
MNFCCSIILLTLFQLDFTVAWLYPCKRLGWGSFTLHKHCVLENVVIGSETPLYRVYFPPVDLEIDSGFIPNFSKAIAERMSAKTKRLSVQFCGVERAFLRDTLEHVELRYNMISEVTFDSAQALKVWSLHLDYNHLRDVSFVSDMESLVILTASKNIISSVSWDTFSRLKHLLTLDLASNLITTIDSKSDLKLPGLKRLILADNRIENLDFRRLSLSDVKEFNISFNHLLSLNLFDFERTFPALESVDVSNNPWNCERHRRLDDRMILKGAIKRRSTSSEQIGCHEDQLESVALTTPDEVHKMQYHFNTMRDFYLQELSQYDTNRRIAIANERFSYLEYDLEAMNSSLHKLNQKTAHLFEVYHLRKSRNVNITSIA